jgi:uncharacterized membrane protein
MNEAQPASNGRSGSRVVHRNIAALVKERQRSEDARTVHDHIADAMTAMSGTMAFVYGHAIWFGGWILWNVAASEVLRFDPYPFGMLTTIVSLEAIFLATFVLITQNRQAKLSERRAELDVQVDLLAEHEITRLIRVVDAIAERVGANVPKSSEDGELKQDIHPDEMLEEIEEVENGERGR